jgi:hypothetical protein
LILSFLPRKIPHGAVTSLPQRTREAAKLASFVGNMSMKLLEEDVSKSHARGLIHGPHRLYSERDLSG